MPKALLISLFMLFALTVTACGESPNTDDPGVTGPTKTAVLTVDGMTCATCPIVVRKSLERVEGVQSAQVDFKAKTAAVSYDPTVVSLPDLIAATTDAGFPSKPTGQRP